MIQPLVKGLFTEGQYQVLPYVQNETLSVNISQLIPKPYGTVLPSNPIDKWLAKGIPGAVRLFFGRGPNDIIPSADWLALGKVTVYDPVDGKTSTVTRWWEQDVQGAQADAVSKLAAEYDGRISLIFIANGGTTYAEPFIRGIQSVDTRRALLAAGYTMEADKASYVSGYSMFKAFRYTRLAQAFNPWQWISNAGTGGVDLSFTLQMIDTFCEMFPHRAVLQNNSIRVPVLSPLYQQMYDHMRSSGHPVRFQTATKPRVGSFAKTLDWALTYGAHAVELSPGFQDCSVAPCLTNNQLAHYDAELRAK